MTKPLPSSSYSQSPSACCPAFFRGKCKTSLGVKRVLCSFRQWLAFANSPGQNVRQPAHDAAIAGGSDSCTGTFFGRRSDTCCAAAVCRAGEFGALFLVEADMPCPDRPNPSTVTFAPSDSPCVSVRATPTKRRRSDEWAPPAGHRTHLAAASCHGRPPSPVPPSPSHIPRSAASRWERPLAWDSSSGAGPARRRRHSMKV